ncbi:unnamed protein product [Choristocarpus tenellus]
MPNSSSDSDENELIHVARKKRRITPFLVSETSSDDDVPLGILRQRRAVSQQKKSTKSVGSESGRWSVIDQKKGKGKSCSHKTEGGENGWECCVKDEGLSGRLMVGGGSHSSGKRRPKGKGKSKGNGGKRRKGQKLGILGVPRGWDERDCDYDDSEDETYTPSDHTPPRMPSRRDRGSTRLRSRGVLIIEENSAVTNGTKSMSPRGILGISNEILSGAIIRPFMDTQSKCSLQRTCRDMKALINDPGVWEKLHLDANLIGSRSTQSGRVSHMSRDPLFFLARSVVRQSRFSRLVSVSLHGLNLGAMGTEPDLLVQLFKNSPLITRLKLWKSYVQDERLPQPESAVEKAIAEHLPGVRHLAIDIYTSNKGLKVLLEGCRQLQSLHITGRMDESYYRFTSDPYPSDQGMRAFADVGCLNLEALSLFYKSKITAVGVRYALESCPKLKSLTLVGLNFREYLQFEPIIPVLGCIRSLTVVDCGAKEQICASILTGCPRLCSLTVEECQGYVQPKLPIFLEKVLGYIRGSYPANSDPTTVTLEDRTKLLMELRKEYSLPNGLIFRLSEAVNIHQRIAPFMSVDDSGG